MRDNPEPILLTIDKWYNRLFVNFYIRPGLQKHTFQSAIDWRWSFYNRYTLNSWASLHVNITITIWEMIIWSIYVNFIYVLEVELPWTNPLMGSWAGNVSWIQQNQSHLQPSSPNHHSRWHHNLCQFPPFWCTPSLKYPNSSLFITMTLFLPISNRVSNGP